MNNVLSTGRLGKATKAGQFDLKDSSVFRELTRRSVLYLTGFLILGGIVSLAVSGEQRLAPWLLLCGCGLALFLAGRIPVSSSRLFTALHALMGVMTLQICSQVIFGHLEQRVWVLPYYLIWIMLIPTRVVVTGGLTIGVSTAYIAGAEIIPANYILALAAGLVVHFVKIQLVEQLRLATRDPLTGAHNRIYLPILLRGRHAEFIRDRRLSSLVFIDVDGLKQINDACGHVVGDDVLTFVAQTIRKRIRTTDSLFRVGGDEFILFLGGVDEAAAMVAAKDIRHCLKVERPSELPQVTISCGVCAVDAASSPDDWVEQVDQLAYEAKRRGGDIVIGSEGA